MATGSCVTILSPEGPCDTTCQLRLSVILFVCKSLFAILVECSQFCLRSFLDMQIQEEIHYFADWEGGWGKEHQNCLGGRFDIFGFSVQQGEGGVRGARTGQGLVCFLIENPGGGVSEEGGGGEEPGGC